MGGKGVGNIPHLLEVLMGGGGNIPHLLERGADGWGGGRHIPKLLEATV